MQLWLFVATAFEVVSQQKSFPKYWVKENIMLWYAFRRSFFETHMSQSIPPETENLLPMYWCFFKCRNLLFGRMCSTHTRYYYIILYPLRVFLRVLFHICHVTSKWVVLLLHWPPYLHLFKSWKIQVVALRRFAFWLLSVAPSLLM